MPTKEVLMRIILSNYQFTRLQPEVNLLPYNIAQKRYHAGLLEKSPFAVFKIIANSKQIPAQGRE